jgi:hypothetical protein
MFRRFGTEFDSGSCLDSLSSCGYSGFSLRVVLLDDSSAAEDLAGLWNSGDFDDSRPSMSAPWSGPDGTSYRSLTGPVNSITHDFIPLLSMETGKAHVLPMFGEWCVCLLDLTEGEWVSDETAAGTCFLNLVSSSTHEIVLSRGISSLAGKCGVTGITVVPFESGDSTPVVILADDTLSVTDILRIMTMMEPVNFAGEIPGELSFLTLPERTVNTEITLWFYVKSIAQRYALAAAATEQGISVPIGTLNYVRAESVVREHIMHEAVLDSTQVADWFSENQERFSMPERRSVLLGYTDSLSSLSQGSYQEFEDVPGLQTVVNQAGEIVPTPPQVLETFGPELGPAVFAAEPGVLTGPVYPGGELAGWFKVVEIVPPGPAALEEVFPVVALTAAQESFAERFEEMMEDLRAAYPVVIDTSAVLAVDLWGSAQ